MTKRDRERITRAWPGRTSLPGEILRDARVRHIYTVVYDRDRNVPAAIIPWTDKRHWGLIGTSESLSFKKVPLIRLDTASRSHILELARKEAT